MERLGEHLTITLPARYEIKKDTDKNGKSILSILYNKQISAYGKETAEISASISEEQGSIKENANLNSKFRAGAAGMIMKIGFTTSFGGVSSSMKGETGVYYLVSVFSWNDHLYNLTLSMSVKGDKAEEAYSRIAKCASEILNAVRIDGESGDFQPLSASFVKRLLEHDKKSPLPRQTAENTGPDKNGSWVSKENNETHKKQTTENTATDDPKEKARREHEEDIRRIKEKRKPQDSMTYRKVYREWEKECETVRKKRDEIFTKLYEVEKACMTAKAERALKEERNRQNKLIKIASFEKENAEKTLQNTGFFRFGEKKTLRADIDQRTAEIAAANKAISVAEEEYRKKVQYGSKELHACVVTARRDAMRAYEMPEEPTDPDEPSFSVRWHRAMKSEILYAIGDRACYTIEEIRSMIGEDEATTNMFLRELKKEWKISNVEIDHKWYIRLA